MKRIWELLGDKERKGKTSSGRLVAIWFAFWVALCLVLLAYRGVDIGFGWSSIAIATVFAVAIQKWLASPDVGPSLTRAIIERLNPTTENPYGRGAVGGHQTTIIKNESSNPDAG
jgi:hypothetical protein